MSMTLYGLAKKAGIKNPQYLYNLYKSGGIAAERVTCEGQFETGCGHTAIMVSDEAAAQYLAKRAERTAKQDAERKAEIEAMRADIEKQVREELEAEAQSA